MRGPNTRIVVFGAGGFVGGWICEELSRRDDIEVLACVRQWSSAVRLARRELQVHRVDLEDRSRITELLEGADVVINAAMPPPALEARLVASLQRACLESGGLRLVQFSSAAIYGDRTGQVDESMTPTPVDDYGRGKTAMEERLTTAVGREMSAVILRPSIVYGPFSDAWTVRYVERVVKGRWRHLGSMGTGTCNLIHAHDVARAAIAAAVVDLPKGTHIVNLNGPDVVTWNDYIEGLGDSLGINDRRVPGALAFRTAAITAEAMRWGASIPFVKSLYRRSTGATQSAMKSAQGVTKLYPSAGELKLLGRQVHYTGDRAADLLGISPSTTMEEGIRQSVAWCQVHGIV